MLWSIFIVIAVLCSFRYQTFTKNCMSFCIVLHIYWYCYFRLMLYHKCRDVGWVVSLWHQTFVLKCITKYADQYYCLDVDLMLSSNHWYKKNLRRSVIGKQYFGWLSFWHIVPIKNQNEGYIFFQLGNQMLWQCSDFLYAIYRFFFVQTHYQIRTLHNKLTKHCNSKTIHKN